MPLPPWWVGGSLGGAQTWVSREGGGRLAPERGVGEGDLEAMGTAPRPAELRPRSQVRATGLAGELGLGAGDLAQVAFPLAFRSLLKRCF